MELSYEQKREYRRKLMRVHRDVSRAVAVYQTPALFNSPDDSHVARERAVGFFPTIQTVWHDIDAFEAAKRVRKGVHSLWHGGLPIDFELTRNRADVLLVVFHGALELNAALPIFSGANVSSGLNLARLSFTDPSLYLSPELPLAWHAGNRFQPDLQQVTTRIIRKTAASVGAKRIVLFGSSGGGFASLVQAAAIPSATALIANAQTNALLYHEDHVQTFINLAWGGDRDAFLAAGGYSAVDKLGEADRVPRILYMQNSTDVFHIRGHLDPFVKAFGDSPNIQLLFGGWGDGHIAPPKSVFHAALRAVVENDELALRSLGFTSASSYKLA